MMQFPHALSPSSDVFAWRRLLHSIGPRVRVLREHEMKNLAWLLLAALPLQGMAQERMEDPIARPCYYCTNDEMSERARSLGVGEHYVYNSASQTNIQGFNVTNVGGELVATHFVPPAWIRTQYNAMMKLYQQSSGRFVDQWGTVNLQPPGSPHVFMEQIQSDTVLWGHHVTDLNPRHLEARETVRRMLTRASRFDFLKADTEHGRILRFESQLQGGSPLISRLNIFLFLGWIESFFDYDTRQWVYLQSSDGRNLIQESADDFVRPDGSPRRLTNDREFDPYFRQRAAWAGVDVVGTLPDRYRDATYLCSRTAGKIQCLLQSVTVPPV